MIYIFINLIIRQVYGIGIGVLGFFLLWKSFLLLVLGIYQMVVMFVIVILFVLLLVLVYLLMDSDSWGVGIYWLLWFSVRGCFLYVYNLGFLIQIRKLKWILKLEQNGY